MSAFETVSLETLSDDDAVSLLFQLAVSGEQAREKLLQLDAVVYDRLLQTYGTDELPEPRQLAA